MKTRGLRILGLALQLAFYLAVLALFVSRGVSAGFSHDENQFIAAGQLLADHGLLPYVDYPYTHMPYAAFFYALTAWLSPYDFLLGRLLNAAAWFGSSVLIAKAFFTSPVRARSPLLWLWEFTVVYLFLNNDILGHIVGNALNHSIATLFSLLALAFFMSAARPRAPSLLPAFLAGAFVCLAGFTRFNYASLIVVLGALLVLQGQLSPGQLPPRSVDAYSAGVAAGAIPALALFIAAPSAFLYGNLLYVRLNTIYYEDLLYRVNMQFDQKLLDFATYLIATPVDLALYVLVMLVLVRSILQYSKSRSAADLSRLAAAACAITLALTAFVPSPTQPQYFLAAIPFLFVVLSTTGVEVHGKSRLGHAALAVGLLVALHTTVRVRSPIAALHELGRPSSWTPLQAHAFDESLRKYVPAGPILSLLPMLPLEAGYPVYPFAATGPFSWRTSLLLTAGRRAQYGVTSPQELPALLAHQPPQAILTGFESTNAGFARNDLGGLETAFLDYARANGFRGIPLPAPFLEQSITLWIRPP